MKKYYYITCDDCSEAILLIEDEESEKDLLAEVDGTLPYVREFVTVGGKTILSRSIFSCEDVTMEAEWCNEYKTNYQCRRCGTQVTITSSDGYRFFCPCCNEDLYSFEATYITQGKLQPAESYEKLILNACDNDDVPAFEA